MDDIMSESRYKDGNPSNEINPDSPVHTKMVEFSTPIPDKKRKIETFQLDMQKSPDAESDSPSSVLNPPCSLKRRTIRDYFLTSWNSWNTWIVFHSLFYRFGVYEQPDIIPSTISECHLTQGIDILPFHSGRGECRFVTESTVEDSLRF